MDRVRPKNRWFHTVVVVGASLGGCGGQSARQVGGTDAGAGGSGGAGAAGGAGASGFGGSAGSAGGVSRPDDCSSDAEFVCSDYTYGAPRDCRCDESVPHLPTDCPSPFAFRCQAFWPDLQITPHYVGCTCARAYVTPEDCATPRQLICDSTDHGLANCHCDPSLPTSPDECRDLEYWSCQSLDPEFGCDCHCCIIL